MLTAECDTEIGNGPPFGEPHPLCRLSDTSIALASECHAEHSASRIFLGDLDLTLSSREHVMLRCVPCPMLASRYPLFRPLQNNSGTLDGVRFYSVQPYCYSGGGGES